MTWTPYLALQYFWASQKAYTHYGFILYAGTAVPLQGAWNCFNYMRTRQLRHARELFSSLISSLAPSRRQSSAGFTEQETRYTTIGADPNTIVAGPTRKSLLDDDDDKILSYFSNPDTRSCAQVDPNYWIANNSSVPVQPSFFPILNSSILIPNGSAQLISERIKDVLRSRSIVAVYDSIGAKADCTTKNNVSFRIRLYCSREDTDSIIVEIQRREGFHFMYQQDVTAIFDAAEGNTVTVDPEMAEPLALLELLEVLANSTSCLVGNADGLGSPINDTIRLHLVLLVHNASANPRAADFARFT